MDPRWEEYDPEDDDHYWGLYNECMTFVETCDAFDIFEAASACAKALEAGSDTNDLASTAPEDTDGWAFVFDAFNQDNLVRRTLARYLV